MDAIGAAGTGNPWLWGAFGVFVLLMLALDLGVFHRRAHEVKPREALAWSAVWVTLALAFGGVVWVAFGPARAQEYVTGWLIEKSLSVDNLFVFLVIFGAFGVPTQLQHKVLFYGILSALVLRGAMILGGGALLERFHWMAYVFGAFLAVTGVRLWLHRWDAPDPDGGPLARWVRRLVPSTARFSGGRFFVREGGRLVATPLLLALATVELSDVVFAVDSIPAIFAVTSDPFIVFTSNVFAILGLRSLYFVLAALLDRFAYLKTGLALVLVFVGAKMGLATWVKVPAAVSLGVILILLGGSIGYSFLQPRAARKAAPHGSRRAAI